MTEWQPISTAPTDGTIVLVASEGRTYVAAYKPFSCFGWAFVEDEFELEKDPEWVNRYEVKPRMNVWHVDHGPTHWMPLPSAPKP